VTTAILPVSFFLFMFFIWLMVGLIIKKQ